MSRSELARTIKLAFRNPRDLAAKLGIDRGAKRQTAGGVTVCCPAHAERTPSCSVTLGPDGSVRFKCFGCDAGGDALTMIALVRGLDLKAQFREVLESAAEMGGLWAELEELRKGRDPNEPRLEPVARPAPELPPERQYPEQATVKALWTSATSVAEDRFARAEIERRGLDALSVANADLARIIPSDFKLPSWARYQGMTWNHTGHRMVILGYDCAGAARSVRAWKIDPNEGDVPKRLPPGGCKASQLVLANPNAVSMLRGRRAGGPIVITEGEPDFLVRAMRNPWAPVIGIGSGSWHPGFAERVPYGAEVVVRTHRDQAGDRYAEKVVETLKDRAVVHRLVIEESEPS